MSRADIVEQNNSAGFHLWQPVSKIVRDSFVRVQPVDMQEANGVIGELSQRLIEASSQQIGELPVKAIVVAADCLKYLFPVAPGVFIPLPMIHGIANRIEPLLLHRLAKSEVGLAPVSSEFDDETGPKSGNQLAGEGQMASPLTYILGLVAAGEKSWGRKPKCGPRLRGRLRYRD